MAQINHSPSDEEDELDPPALAKTSEKFIKNILKNQSKNNILNLIKIIYLIFIKI